jgi:hypothetical protein
MDEANLKSVGLRAACFPIKVTWMGWVQVTGIVLA